MTFKKILCIGLALLSTFTSAISVSAREAGATLSEDAELMATVQTTIGDFVYEIDSDTLTAKIIAISTSGTDIAVQNTIPYGDDVYRITTIADGVGNGNQTIRTLNLENAENLIEIGENCFSYCPNLTTVILPTTSSITTIGSNTFYYCQNLTTVNYDTHQTVLTDVGSSVFGLTPYMDNKTAASTDDFVMFGKVLVKYIGSSTDVIVPTDTLGIADAFLNSDVVSVSLPATVMTVGSNAFYGCRSLESISLPASCTKVGDMAFAGCSALKNVEYEGGLTSIGFCSFTNCSELVNFKNTGTAQSNLTSIGECAFWNTKKLRNLDVGVITNVNAGSFWNCSIDDYYEDSNLDYYRIPDKVKTIANGGYGDLNFSYITLPASIEAFAPTAFGSSEGKTLIIKKDNNSSLLEYFANSGYNYNFYGDMNSDNTIDAKDIKALAQYIAQGITGLSNGGIIADINSDNTISTKDLFDIFQSIRANYEAEQETAAE